MFDHLTSKVEGIAAQNVFELPQLHAAPCIFDVEIDSINAVGAQNLTQQRKIHFVVEGIV
jgi:hypothetical protein